ncbi:MAG: LuxR C-terminal-related transcriptional regulator [Oscillospiraceae bacterium]
MPKRDRLPLQHKILHRPRLHALIEEGLRQPLLVMLAGPGYGKTQALASYLSRGNARILWLRLNTLDNLREHFWGHFVYALDHDFPDIARHLTTLEFPDTPSKFDAFLHILIKETRLKKPIVWVFDDFGEITDRLIKSFFWALADTELDNFRLVLMSNVLTSTESIAFMTNKRSLVLGKDLRFTREEIVGLYDMYNIRLEPGELDKIERYTEGWPLCLHLLAMDHDRLPHHKQQLTHDEISYLFEDRFFSAYSERQQKLIIKLSLLNSFTKEFAVSIYEGESAELEALGNHVFLSNEPSTGRFFLHNLYRAFLQKKKYLLSDGEENKLWQDAAEYCMASGYEIDAISCYGKCGNRAGVIEAICRFIQLQHGISGENAAFFLDQLDDLTPEEITAYPIATYIRALIYVNTLEIGKAEALLLELESRLLADGIPVEPTLLGDVYALLAPIHMMRNQEDFGDYYKKAAGYLPEGTVLQRRQKLSTQNNHNFSMADSLPGALQRMERIVHESIPWANRALGGGMAGMEYIFSAEAAYLTNRLEEAREHAYRAVYKAEANAQHDLVCNGYCILARVGFAQGDFNEMTRQVENVTEYAGRYEIGTLKEIRDTVLGWYYVKLHDCDKVPKGIARLVSPDRPVLAHDRSQIVYANYLLNTGEYARLVGMLESPVGLYVTQGIWPDRICRYILLAIGYYYLKKPDKAVNALWEAYDMSFHNGLTTLFVEAEKHMCNLVDAASHQNTYEFDSGWLDAIQEQAALFSGRATAVRTAYLKQNPVNAAGDNPLTKREMEVLTALSRGLTREEIASAQYVSVNTVKTFIRSIYNKLDAANRAEAVSVAISRGYIDVSSSRQ